MTFSVPFVKTQHKSRAVRFDGVNDWITRDAALTGIADSKLLTGSFWIRKQGVDGVLGMIIEANSTLAGSNLIVRISKSATNRASFQIENAAGTSILIVGSSVNVTVANGWQHILFSFDMADTAKRWLYRNDVTDLDSITTYTNDTMAFTLGLDWAIGARADGGSKLDADLAQVALWPGVYLDLSVTANRRLFIDASAKPVDLGPYGTFPGLGVPALYHRGSAAAFNFNVGSGENPSNQGWQIHGALTDSATSPSD